MKTILILSFLMLAACSKDHQYIGPSIAVSGGYQGVTVGVAVAGQNPATPVIVQAQPPTTTTVSAK
jgi:hypothetical protein